MTHNHTARLFLDSGPLPNPAGMPSYGPDEADPWAPVTAEDVKPAAVAEALDLDAVRERNSRYEALADRMDADARLPGMNAPTSARTIGLIASFVAGDVPALLAAVDALTGALDGLLAVHDTTGSWPDADEAVANARALRDALGKTRPEAGA